MGQDYDKIFKENIEPLVLPLARKVLRLPEPAGLTEIADDLQRTIERRPDYLKLVTDERGISQYVLQIEFQTTDEPKMVFRMLEYAGLLVRRYELPVRQFVLYIGEQPSRMNTRLSLGDISFRYTLCNLIEIPYTDFLNSQQPEEVVLAILGGMNDEEPEVAIQQIIQKLKQTSHDRTELSRSLHQLEVLAKLRNLQDEIIKQTEAMPFVYDLETDIRFLQGVEKGQLEGLKKGLQEGLQEGKQKAILGLIKLDVLSDEQIAQALSVSVADVRSLRPSS